MSKFIYGVFNDDDAVMHAIKPLKQKGVNIKDVISPFPLHGLDHELGLKRTRIAICAFIYGCIGCSLALLMMWYMNIHDWPMDIGGKPSFFMYKNLPAFIPVTFESTVLCTAHGMVITFYLRSWLLPGVTAPQIHERVTDDHFVMKVAVKDPSKEASITALLKEHGAVEVRS